MEILIIILAPVLWLCYSVLEGTREGFFYAYRDADDPGCKKDLHALFTVQRVIMALALMLPFLTMIRWYFLPLAPISWMMIFPLVHDGIYYMTRNDLDGTVYPNRFRTSKNTSTARVSIESFFGRLYLALGACIVYGIFVWLIIN